MCLRFVCTLVLLVHQVLLGVEVTLLRNNRSKVIVNPGPLPIPPMSIFGVKAFVIAKDEVRCVPGCGRLRLYARASV